MHCKSLWIKASAKCINVNVNIGRSLVFSCMCCGDLSWSFSPSDLIDCLSRRVSARTIERHPSHSNSHRMHSELCSKVTGNYRCEFQMHFCISFLSSDSRKLLI